jgi:hypothetical protein
LSGETEKEVSGWTIDTLKILLEVRMSAHEKALSLAREELERRLDGLNQLRQEVTQDRSQFVKTDVYYPAHEELRRQRISDNEKITVLQGDVKNNATDIAQMKSSLMWLTRLIAGALVLGIIAYVFQRLTGR